MILKNKISLVTGGATGIGKATVETFKEFFRLLKKDGILLIFTPNANSIAFDYMMEKQNLVTPPIHLHYFNKKSIEKLGDKPLSLIYFKIIYSVLKWCGIGMNIL